VRAGHAHDRRSRWGLIGCILAVVLGGVTVGATPVTTISPNVAALYVGEQQVIEGTVTAAERDGATVRLRLGMRPHELTVSLIIGLLSNFPPEPEHFYAARTVRVVGTVRSFRGATEMVIRDPADIQIVGAPPPGEAHLEPAAETEVQQLKQKVQQLEQRVHELETPRPPDQPR